MQLFKVLLISVVAAAGSSPQRNRGPTVMVRTMNQIRAQWRNLESQLQRQYDLRKQQRASIAVRYRPDVRPPVNPDSGNRNRNNGNNNGRPINTSTRFGGGSPGSNTGTPAGGRSSTGVRNPTSVLSTTTPVTRETIGTDGLCRGGKTDEELRIYGNETVVEQTKDYERWQCDLTPRKVSVFTTKINQCMEAKNRGTSDEWASGRIYELHNREMQLASLLSLGWDRLEQNRLGYRVTSQPSVGSMAFFKPNSPTIGPKGHFAVVEGTPNGQVCLSEWEAPYRNTLTTTLMPNPKDTKYISFA